jgi:hypothetical protein
MSNEMSRRRALLLSLGGALGLTLPTALIASEEAEAQTTETPASGTAPATGTPGTQRRQHRRITRHQRREVRRAHKPAATAPAAQPQQLPAQVGQGMSAGNDPPPSLGDKGAGAYPAALAPWRRGRALPNASVLTCCCNQRWLCVCAYSGAFGTWAAE